MSVIKLNISEVSPGFSASDNMFQSPALQSGGGDGDGLFMFLLIAVIVLLLILSGISGYYGYKKYMAAPTAEAFQSRTIDDERREYY